MKKVLFSLFLIASIFSKAQTNLQVHYDFGEGRKYVTTTFEMFKPDKWGNTFCFVDFDYNASPYNHPSLAYMEIARCLKFWKGPLSLQVEYNGGLGYDGISGFSINNCYLAGIDYGINNADYTKTLNLKALFKKIAGKQNTPQFTAVWGLHFMDRKISFTGFADFWFEKNTFNYTDNKTNPVFISEPQLWYNFTENFSAGSEVELATNFGGVEGFKACPTLAVKWNF